MKNHFLRKLLRKNELNILEYTVLYTCLIISSQQFLLLLLLLLLLLSRFSRVRLCATPETAAHQAPRPWDSPGKNTGVGRHFLLQCMKVKRESEVSQLCPTPCDPMDCSPPGSPAHGIFQARGQRKNLLLRLLITTYILHI